MSSYERYDATARHYDHTRWPIGVEIVVGCLAQGPAPLAKARVLDAGCGTGNYSRALLEQVAHIDAVDHSAGMLAAARDKLAEAAPASRIAFHQASIDALPFEDDSFDGAMVNQVLHHLGDEPEAGWPLHCRVLAELARVLRPGGVLVVNSCSHQQTREAFWPYHLIPEARDAILERLMPLAAIEDAMAEIGLQPRGRFVPVDAILQGPDFLDPLGPLRPDWRAGDSIWALVDDTRLAWVEQTLRNLECTGRLPDWLAEHDARRPAIGQITFLHGIKR
jgi:SAM-dependent methyltransferase